MHLLFYFLITGFWIVPGRLTFFDGPTQFIGLTDIPILLLLGLVCFVLPWKSRVSMRNSFAVLFLVLTILKLLLGSLWTDNGLVARYYANPDFQEPVEQSWVYASLRDATRIDTKVDFHDVGYSPYRQSFPLYFANDWARFNWFGADKPKRQDFLFSAQWQGYLNIRDDDPRQAILLVSGGHTKLAIDGQEIASVTNNSITFPLTPGLHTIELEYARIAGGQQQLMLGWQTAEDELIAIPSSRLQPSTKDTSTNSVMGLANIFLALAWMILLSVFMRMNLESPANSLAFRERIILFSGVTLLLMVAYGHAVNDGRTPDADILGGGNDWLLYETQAQNILSGDWLDADTTRHGVFKMNVLYRYLLAALHVVFGESSTAVVVGQQAVMIGILLFLYTIGKRLYSRKIGALVVAQAFVFQDMLLVFPKQLLDTTFNIGFSLAALYYLLQYGRAQLLKYTVFAGLFLGLAIFVRANFALLIPVGLIWIWWQARNPAISRATHLGLFLLFASLPFATIGLRNLVVADQFVMIPTTGAVNLWVGNQTIKELRETRTQFVSNLPQREKIPEKLVARIKEQPLDFVAVLAVKTIFILGVDLRSGFEIHTRILIPAILAFLSVLYWMIRAGPNPVRNEVAFMTMWTIAIALPLIAIFPWGYGWRLTGSILPVWYLLNALLISAIFTDEMNWAPAPRT